ncbi:isocitrate lyase/phosphoenolpyruvate mutase family protein [Chelativorans sp. M5D2P16]|uniref:isocitrate lyase/PEP mutase family protein n=1 Tax=Chelativorans sp. M5D2P16 TaxID=3095678 RepID=UPI002ACA1392|nr:isocitrate lyase/phosphoenolpyruvate mutase family protein [Chelativorans sp. M5D2P16]MDZ5697248.1 isocitrate lyase/phosphoenolpyruvate mutase family protein [Chelativorans sp. M5D2P16]
MRDIGSIFRALHEDEGVFVLPNPWDVGTARLLAAAGFKALATTSAGYAFSRGLPDGGVHFEERMDHCREIVAATPLPVSADLEHGKGESPDSAAETVFAAEAAGLAGCSIEDATGDPARPIYDFSLAVERVAAAAEAARSLKRDFVFTARAENFLWGRADLEDTIARLQAFEKAGADVLYAPGLSELDQVRAVCTAAGKPVNVLATADFSVSALAEAGAKRISLGSKLTNLAFGAVERAAREMLEEGTFTFAQEVMPFARLQAMFSERG